MLYAKNMVITVNQSTLNFKLIILHKNINTMDKNTNDNSVLAHITALTEKEEQLYAKPDLTEADITDLHHIKSELDQYWDLLRQRRAFKDSDRNPDTAEIRPVDQIENYEE
jgi:Protein of unknown function (DUF2630)